ncbi:MAG TPA: hypothetical protein VFW42_06345 [Fluviicoccus sp.]|nr:hypothetical protein [Fluviicoccus sp.]
MRLRRLVLTVIPMALLTGCSTFQAYDGQARPEREIAVAKTSLRVIPLLLVNVISGYGLKQLDDKPLKGTTILFEPGRHRLTFTPGTAVILAGYGGGGVIAPKGKLSCAFTADFQAGHTYRLGVGSVKTLPLTDGSTTSTGTVRLKDSAKGQRTRKTDIPVICHTGPVDYCQRDAECPGQSTAMRCDLPAGQPVGTCFPAAP